MPVGCSFAWTVHAWASDQQGLRRSSLPAPPGVDKPSQAHDALSGLDHGVHHVLEGQKGTHSVPWATAGSLTPAISLTPTWSQTQTQRKLRTQCFSCGSWSIPHEVQRPVCLNSNPGCRNSHVQGVFRLHLLRKYFLVKLQALHRCFDLLQA